MPKGVIRPITWLFKLAPFYVAKYDAAPEAVSDEHAPFYVTNLTAPFFVTGTKKMSYDVSAFYVAGTNLKNRPEALHKPSIGILSDRNAPLIKSNDKKAWSRAKMGQLPHAQLEVLLVYSLLQGPPLCLPQKGLSAESG